MVHGITADEILDACDEKTDIAVGDRLSNPTISIAQAVRRHNFATFRNLANQQIKRAQVASSVPERTLSRISELPKTGEYVRTYLLIHRCKFAESHSIKSEDQSKVT